VLSLILVLTPALAGETFQGHRYYLGDLHSHTGASGDGGSSDLGTCSSDCGAVADLGTYARSAGLDFVAVTDHVNGPAVASQTEFGLVWAQMLAEHDPQGGLVTIPGAEIWLRWPDGSAIGHKDLLLFGDNAALSGFRVSHAQPTGDEGLTLQDCSELWSWMSSVEGEFGPALLLPHHPALSIPMETDWSCHDDSWSPAVEVYSEHGNSLNHPSDYDPPWSTPVPESTVETALNLGLVLGFVGGTDAHNSRPGSVCGLDGEAPDHPYGGGLTVAVLPEGEDLSRAGLYEAIVDHRTYTTTGPLVPVDLAWRVSGESVGGHGATPQVPSNRELELVVTLSEAWDAKVISARLRGPDAWWELVSEGGGRRTLSLAADVLPDWIYLDLTLDAEQPEGCMDGGDDALEHLWFSPVWPSVVGEQEPAETGATGDANTDSEPGDSAEGRTGRCGGCSATSPVPWAWWGVLVLAMTFRQRQAARSSGWMPRAVADKRSA
jgi:hypothetical protein